MQRVRIYGDPILREPAQLIEKIDESLRKLVEEMFHTMEEAQGVGLAAPQVGLSIALAVLDPSPLEEGAEPFVIINPRIVEADGEFCYEEGCLSIPDIRMDVVRPEHVVVEGLNLEGRPICIETGGIIARILQHEIDHLNGTLFVDHIGTVQRRMIESSLEEMRKNAGGDGT